MMSSPSDATQTDDTSLYFLIHSHLSCLNLWLCSATNGWKEDTLYLSPIYFHTPCCVTGKLTLKEILQAEWRCTSAAEAHLR